MLGEKFKRQKKSLLAALVGVLETVPQYIPRGILEFFWIKTWPTLPNLGSGELGDLKVSSFFINDQRKWDFNKVKALFNLITTTVILNIIHSPTSHCDKRF